MKFAAGLLTAMLLVQPVQEPVPVEPTFAVHENDVPTPVLDSYTDVDEAERQGLCLWEWMQAEGLEITLKSVLVAGEWTDLNGGACLLIGEDDE